MQTGSQEAQEAQEQASHSIFDVPGSAVAAPIIPAQQTSDAPNGDQQGDSLFSDTLFDDNDNNGQSPDPDSDLIAKLQASGYKVEKSEVVDEDKKTTDLISFHESNIKQAEDFIRKDDRTIVFEKVKNDKADKYTATGRGHLINSEEFEIECEAEMDADYDNASFLKMQADNIRALVKQNVIDRNAQEKEKIVVELENKTKVQIQEKQKKLDASFDTIYKEGFMGMKFDKETIIDARNKVINGKFTQDIKNNPEILAELALVYYQKEALIKKAGGATYGEGVAAAYHALNGGDKSKGPTSSMSAARQIDATGQEGVFNLKKWLNEANDDDKDKKVIL